MLVILHSGQTGVERGAHRGAALSGICVSGVMSLDRRDELGPVPPDVAEHLTPCDERGPRPAVRANIARADGVLLVVPDATRADKFTAMGAVLAAVRAAHVPLLACDPITNLDDVVWWVRRLPENEGSTRLLVTGPRGTRWNEGEAVARRIVSAIGMST
jgi:hypothetical protein